MIAQDLLDPGQAIPYRPDRPAGDSDQLVALDQVAAELFEPPREALVQLGPGRLRQRLVGSVADKQVAEAEAVLARKQRPVGPDQLSAHQRRQPRADRRVRRAERLHRATMEDLPLDRAAFEYAPLGALELIEPRRQQRPQRRRHR